MPEGAGQSWVPLPLEERVTLAATGEHLPGAQGGRSQHG